MADLGLIPGLGRSPGGGHGNPLQYPCLGNPQGLRSLVDCSPRGHRESDWVTKHNTAIFCDMDMLHFDAHSQLIGIWLVSNFWQLMNHEHLCNVIRSYCVFSFLSRMYKHRSGISGSCSNSNFCGTASRSSRVTAPFYISSNNVWGFQFLHVFPISFIVLLFDCHSNGCGVSWFLICLSPMSNNLN